MQRDPKYSYTKKDFHIEYFSGTGPGGQHRNKVQACVRITHIPSGLKATCQTHRSRQANFKEAFHALGAKIKEWVEAQIAKEHQRTPSTETIRTYHFADNRVTDHASGLKIPTGQLDKKFGDLITARAHSVAMKERK